MKSLCRVLTSAVVLLALAGCAGGGANTPLVARPSEYLAGRTDVALTTADRSSSGACSVSSDGLIWYTLPNGPFPPLDFEHVQCAVPTTIAADVTPPTPAWSQPSGSTQAIFVATSLQETYSLTGMEAIERIASSAGVPISWLIGNPRYLEQNATFYNAAHARNGDDVELENAPGLYQLAATLLPWYAPAVSVEGAGHERNIAGARALRNRAYWGITWNSHGTDNTSDLGAPWGSYCADASSYKRPSPSGDCSFVALEWTARDLTRAFLADTHAAGYSAEAAFSSDPDDILLRGGFDLASGADYARRLVDAYAAAGTSQPLVMMSQQESIDEGTRGSAGDDFVLTALYEQAKRDGMKAMTLRQAAAVAGSFSENSRAIAFPFIPGGVPTSYNGVAFTPATIDYHDRAVGMTFVAGHTLPMRLFAYAQDSVSTFDHALRQIDVTSAAYPRLTSVAVSNGTLNFHFDAPQALRFGVALWNDPAALGISGMNVTRAGRAGAVVAFDLPAGPSDQSIMCSSCTSTTFAYSR